MLGKQRSVRFWSSVCLFFADRAACCCLCRVALLMRAVRVRQNIDIASSHNQNNKLTEEDKRKMIKFLIIIALRTSHPNFFAQSCPPLSDNKDHMVLLKAPEQLLNGLVERWPNRKNGSDNLEFKTLITRRCQGC